MNKKGQRGYTLLISVIVISTVLLLVAAAAARGIAGLQGAATSGGSHTDAKALAESCADVAMLKIRQNQLYAGDETVAVGASSCTIRPISPGIPAILETEATADGRTYRLRIQLSDLDPLTISSWQRVPSF